MFHRLVKSRFNLLRKYGYSGAEALDFEEDGNGKDFDERKLHVLNGVQKSQLEHEDEKNMFDAHAKQTCRNRGVAA